MLPAPGLNLLHVLVAMEVARVLTAPLLLTRSLAGGQALRLQTESLMPSISPARPEPNPAVATLSQSFRAHQLLPLQSREEYETSLRIGRLFACHNRHARFRDLIAKKEEDDPFGSGRE